MNDVVEPGDKRFRPWCVAAVDVLRTSDPGMESSPFGGGSTTPSLLVIIQWGWCFHTMRDGIDPGDRRLRLQFVGVADV